jgi:2-amino-4-hydroxy-6-hydroxymethyldihydropteridine diphosphokinase
MKVVVGLGANLGDRLTMLREAVRRIELLAPVLARSRVYETVPLGVADVAEDFLNAAVLVEWPDDLDPDRDPDRDPNPIALLDALMKIEADLGRVRTAAVRNESRTIDLDVLWIDGGVQIDHPPRLIVPHPRLHERAFAIAPLLDVAPHAPYVLPKRPKSNDEAPDIRLIDEPL